MIIKRVKVNGYKNLNIDWDLSKSGNIVAILGKNASGKTNLLEALIGFSNVADNSKSIKPNFKGEMELELDGKTVWINGKGVFQKAAVDSLHRKSSKRIIEEFDIPDMLRISVNDEFAPRYFTAQRKFRKFDQNDIRFSVFNEINYGDDFIPFLLYLFSFSKDSFVRKLLLEEFGIESIAPIQFGTVLKDEEILKLKEPTKTYFKIFKNYSNISENNRLHSVLFKEEDLVKLSEKYGYEKDFFEAMHILLGNYYKNSNILYTFDISVMKNGKQIKISDLSDGEKQLIYILSVITYAMGENKILLFDEPDTHIYPTLQMQLVDCFKKIDDKANIIIATHSPYIVSTLNKEDVFYLHEGEIFSVSNTKGKDINSIMTEIFNTPIRDPKIAEIISEIYSILNAETISSNEKESINKMINDLASFLGDDDYDIVTMRAILGSKK